PNGFDAFGLPAENAAIKRGIHPGEWTLSNIEGMKRQFASMGASFSFDHQVITCLPQYYKWNQWIFLKMFDKEVAYRGKAFANWCPKDQTVLADEQVVNGICDRCGTTVVQKQIEQWFLAITKYADRLIWPQNPSVDWPKSVIEGQNNWIGKSQGINISYKIEGTDKELVVFTTRPDTNFGATFVVLAPEHPLVLALSDDNHKFQVQEYIKQAGKKNELERKENKEKTGVFTGKFAINNLNGEKMPIWVADYVLMGYGTGAVVGVPGHDARDFEFAKAMDLPIVRVVVGEDGDTSAITRIEQVQEKEGKMINSQFLDGLDIHKALKKIMDYLEEKGWGERVTVYHLHDWSISRQRYWGTPIPIIHCPKCGLVPIPEADLPVELPSEIDFTPKGKPPLATVEDWVNVKCPKCNGEAKRDTDTMDGFFDNSWYFFRYLDSENDQEIFDKSTVEKWLPLEIYFGGAEHTLGHTLYSRFFTKFFKDLGLINFDEYAKKRVNHGIVLGPDGEKMSKSRGNVINPDQEVKKYGADTIRVYLAFFMPYDATGPWISDRVGGPYRFLQRIWGLFDKVSEEAISTKDLFNMHKTIKKVTVDIEAVKFNTAIASLMEWLNYLSRKEKVSKEEYKTYLLLLAPFAPHITEELWAQIGGKTSIHQQSWPQFDNKYLEEEEVFIVVQVNGKVRDGLLIQKDIVSNKEMIEKIAQASLKVQKFLEGKSVKKTIYVPGKILSFVV
ncbi:leucine--tRNA ligase, partial [Candidatus Daviesbacteria bacterium]|nr:leucine--tRNA ligase [Candidatus Daviesbacteria bacterium]